MMNWFGNNGYGMCSGFGWIFMIFFWGIIFIIIFYGVKYLSKGRPDEGKGKGHEEILKERYAKGEINQEEYEKMKQVLRD